MKIVQQILEDKELKVILKKEISSFYNDIKESKQSLNRYQRKIKKLQKEVQDLQKYTKEEIQEKSLKREIKNYNAQNLFSKKKKELLLSAYRRIFNWKVSKKLERKKTNFLREILDHFNIVCEDEPLSIREILQSLYSYETHYATNLLINLRKSPETFVKDLKERLRFDIKYYKKRYHQELKQKIYFEQCLKLYQKTLPSFK